MVGFRSVFGWFSRFRMVFLVFARFYMALLWKCVKCWLVLDGWYQVCKSSKLKNGVDIYIGLLVGLGWRGRAFECMKGDPCVFLCHHRASFERFSP